jgi:chromosome segregation ATPase
MAENYQDLKKRLEVLTAEREKDKAIISKQKEQIKKLKALLEHSQTELEQRKASEKPDDHRCLSLLAEQLISLRTDLDKRTQPKLMLEEELSPRSRKLSLDLDLPLGSSKSAPRLR